MLSFKTDPATFERVASENGDAMQAISERGKAAGAIHHAFYAGDGEVWVVDEWDDPANFEAFFASEQENIGPLMAAAEVQGEPGPPMVYRKLSTADEF